MPTFYAKSVQDFADEAADGWFTETAPFVGIEEWFMKHVLGLSPAADAVGLDKVGIQSVRIRWDSLRISWNCKQRTAISLLLTTEGSLGQLRSAENTVNWGRPYGPSPPSLIGQRCFPSIARNKCDDETKYAGLVASSDATPNPAPIQPR